MLVQLKSKPDVIVSDCGSVYVWSKRRADWVKSSAYPNSRGYIHIDLTNLYGRVYAAHRLVAEGFFGQSQLQVNHKNGIKYDNRSDNLEYVTGSENMLHAYATGLSEVTREHTRKMGQKYGRAQGLRNAGEGNGQCKLSDAEIFELHAKAAGLPVKKRKELASMCSIDDKYLRAVLAFKVRKYFKELIYS